MDKDRVEGKAKDVKGRIERQTGEWTGDKETQAKGAAHQAEGKAQNALGQAKDAGRKAIRDLDKTVNDDRDKKNDAAQQRVRTNRARQEPRTWNACGVSYCANGLGVPAARY